MRIFLSFHSKDVPLAEAVRAGLKRLEPDADIFFSPVSLGAGFWLPKLAEEIAAADAVLLLIGPHGVGPWQEVEYFTAFDRHVKDKFPLVPVIAGGAGAPGLSFLRTLNWIEAPAVAEDKALHRMLAALKGETQATATPLWKLVNPYRGLEAMTEANADYFHGRANVTQAVLRSLAEMPNRLPVLIGGSGVGKSSVAQAGVLAALKSMRWPDGGVMRQDSWPGAFHNSRNWAWLTMRPADAPFAALTASILRLWQLDTRDADNASMARKWAERLASGSNKLCDLIDATQNELRRKHGEAPERLLLYLDQSEELYTRAGENDARAFSAMLAEGLADRRLLAFASLRADYFHRLQADEPLFTTHEHVNVPPLDRAQLREVVTAPARELDVTFEHAERDPAFIVESAASAPGALPLLSYLLFDMWKDMARSNAPVMRMPAQVVEVGRVLQSRAENFLKENPGEVKALRRLLTLRLAAVPPEGEPVRRQAYEKECTPAEWSLAARLADHPWRLTVIREREADGRIVAEVAHEALLRAWERLRDWLREERDFLVFKGEVERAEHRWREMRESDKALLTGLDLNRAEEWLPQRPEDLSRDVAAFVQRSITADRAAKQRQLRFQRRVSIGAVTAAALMLVLGSFASLKWGEAERATAAAQRARDRAAWAESKAEAELREAQITQSRFLADLARQRLSAGDAGTAILLALEALPDAIPRANRPVVLEAKQQLDDANDRLLERLILKSSDGAARSAAFSPDGKRIIVALGNVAQMFDAATGEPMGVPLAGHQAVVTSAAFSPDGKRIITTSRDRTARLWDAAMSGPIGAPLVGHLDTVTRAAFSPDGKRIVTASLDKTARLWDAVTGEPIGAPLAGHKDGVVSAAFSPDGKRIVTASLDKTARLWDVATGEPISVPLAEHQEVWSATFSPDGRRVVTTSLDKTVRLWDIAAGKPVGAPLAGHQGPVTSAEFSPDGRRIVTASFDGTARMWDVGISPPIGQPLAGHQDQVWSAAFSPDGRWIVTVSADKTVRLWLTSPNWGKLLTHPKSVVPRCLTQAQRKQFFLPTEPPAWCIEMEKWPYHTAEWKQWLVDTRAGRNPPLPAAP